jgi:transcriptional regulator with XRE-family HTH domain
MCNYDAAMTIGDRIRQLRGERAMTQEDLAASAGLGLTTIQRAERGGRLSADSIASLAAAFGVLATDLTNPATDLDDQPYLPLKVIGTGRQLFMLLAPAEQLDLAFVELHCLQQAALVEQLQLWCADRVKQSIPSGAVAQVKCELEGTELLRALLDAGLTVTGATMSVTAYEVDDDCGAGQPILMGQWDYVCAVVRVGTAAEFVDRAYVMDSLGKWEQPGNEVIWPPAPASSDELTAEIF